GADVLKVVMDTVISPPKELTKKRSRLLPQSSRLNINASSSTINIGPSEDAAIVVSISYLTALHGLVWTFPRNMADVFSDPETGILLLSVISSTVIPVLVRQTLLCMISNWCVLYRESINARLNLESIVDTAKMKFGLRPQGRLLPDPPFTRGQEDWPYPTTRPESQQQQQASQQEQFSRSQIFANVPSMWDIRSLGRPASQETTAAKAGTANSTASGPDISQKRSFLSSLRSSPQPTRPAISAPSAPSAPSVPSAPSAARSESQLTPEFVAHIERSVNELVSICDMLTETLISLNVEEDPSENAVVQDMTGEVKQRKTALFNFMSMLGSDAEATMIKLTSASDCADKCLWLYNKTLNSHNEWKTIQESLKTSAAQEARSQALDSTIRSVGSARSYLNQSEDAYAAESSRSMARLLAAASSAPSPSFTTAGGAPSPAASATGSLSAINRTSATSASGPVSGYPTNGHSTPVRQEMSSKAKGKMAEDPLQPSTDSQDWDYHNDDSAYCGSVEDAKRISN
ncbi:hypothetical protein LPJ64_006214, partial [Coemansia asiatica]